jgi:hypothetical protein
MTNINLKTDENSNNIKIDFGKALPISIIVLVIVGLIYSAVLFYTKKIDGEMVAAQENYDQKLSDLKSGNAKNVFDFQNRLSESKKMLKGNLNPTYTLREIEKVMIPGAYLASYQFDMEKKSVSLVCKVSNYNDVAKQILSFKKSLYFSSVSLEGMSLSGQDGKISFGVTLIIK